MKCWEKVDPLANRATQGARTPDVLGIVPLTNLLNLCSFVPTAPSSLLYAASRRPVYTDDEEGETGNGGVGGGERVSVEMWIINVHQSGESHQRRPSVHGTPALFQKTRLGLLGGGGVYKA